MKKTYETPTLVVSGDVTKATLGLGTTGDTVGSPAPAGSVGFLL